MTPLSAYLDGISVIGPGIRDWPTAEACFTGRMAYVPGATELPSPAVLPSAERRRAGRINKLAIALGLEAATRAGIEPGALVTVFCSSGGDGENCNEICQTLASADRQVSPTRFHHSVQNVPAGYWSIATGAMAASTTLCAYDASFAAGLLEALAQVAVHARPVLLIAYDANYPPPLFEKRPIPDAFGTAWVLAASPGPRSLARISASLGDADVERLDDPGLEALRSAVPAARGLPVLARLARRQWGRSPIEYLGLTTLCVEADPC
jgi:hypothetical protein